LLFGHSSSIIIVLPLFLPVGPDKYTTSGTNKPSETLVCINCNLLYLYRIPRYPIVTGQPKRPPKMSSAGHQSGATAAPPATRQKKRLIVCCDGTWMNSDKGWEKGKPQPASNVTRLARSFNRGCSDGSVQVINYQSGVGTGSTMSDAFSGGAFGNGVAEVGTIPGDASLPHSRADMARSMFVRAMHSFAATTSTVTRSSSSVSPVAPSPLGALPA
jgi:hypothetical protein